MTSMKLSAIDITCINAALIVLLMTQCTLSYVIAKTDDINDSITAQPIVNTDVESNTANITNITPKNNNEAVEKTSIKKKFAKEFLLYLFDEYEAFSNETLYALKSIFENVIEDIYKYDNVTRKNFQNEIEPFKKFILELRKNENDNNTIGKFILLTDIIDTLDAYNTTTLTNAMESQEQVARIAQLLRKYHLAEFLQELDKKTTTFVNNLKKEADEIFQKLAETEEGKDVDEFKNSILKFENPIELYSALQSWNERQ